MEDCKIAERIAFLRGVYRVSQQMLADELHVRRETIKFWESGERQVKAADVVKLADYFHVSSDFLLGLTDIHDPDQSIKASCSCTGLLEKSIKKLSDYNNNANREHLLAVDSILLYSEADYLLAMVMSAIHYRKIAALSPDKITADNKSYPRIEITPDMHDEIGTVELAKLYTEVAKSALGDLIEEYASLEANEEPSPFDSDFDFSDRLSFWLTGGE